MRAQRWHVRTSPQSRNPSVRYVEEFILFPSHLSGYIRGGEKKKERESLASQKPLLALLAARKGKTAIPESADNPFSDRCCPVITRAPVQWEWLLEVDEFDEVVETDASDDDESERLVAFRFSLSLTA